MKLRDAVKLFGFGRNGDEKKARKPAIVPLDLRKERATRLHESAKEQGLTDFYLNEDGISGRMDIFDPKSSRKERKELSGELHWRINPYGDLQVAATIPKNLTDATTYLSNLIDYGQSMTSERTKEIDLSRKIAEYEGIAATVKDVLGSLIPMNGWYIKGTDKTESGKRAALIAKEWLSKLNGFSNEVSIESVGGIESLTKEIVETLLTDGDYVGLWKWDTVELSDEGKIALPIEMESFDIKKLEWPKELMDIGQKMFFVDLPSAVVEAAKGNKKASGDKKTDLVNQILTETLSDELKKLIVEYDGRPPLPAEFTVHISRTPSRKGLSKPYFVKTFGAFAYKNRIRQLDNSTIAGLVQRVWIIKIGSDKPESEYHEVDEDRFKLAVATFSKLRTQNILIWPGPDLEKEELTSSDSTVLSFDGRYQEADDDIYRSLGVPRALVDGSEVTGSDLMIFLPTLALLEYLAKQIERMINKTLDKIMLENGITDQKPVFCWNKLEIRDRQGLRTIAERMFQSTLMGRRDALRVAGFDADEIIENQISEKEEKLEELIPIPKIPFSGNGRPNGTPDGGGDGKDNKPPKGTEKTTNQNDT